MSIYKYQRVVESGPDGTTLYFHNTETNDAVELAEIDGWHYVFVPDNIIMPKQFSDIQWQIVTMTDTLREQIKTASRHVRLISEEMQRRIRVIYSLEDEQYFARIGVGVALGVYTFQPDEQTALMAFGSFVEEVRQWGRTERKKIGL